MSRWRRKKNARKGLLNKRVTPHEHQERYEAARAAVRRLYCDVLGLWRAAQCGGAPGVCLKRGADDVPGCLHDEARAQVMAGGPRRIPAATRMERGLRQYPLSSLG
jgi:hypothetical protein